MDICNAAVFDGAVTTFTAVALSLPTSDLQEKCAGGFRQSAEWWSNWWELAGTKISRYRQCIPGSGTYPGCNEWIVMHHSGHRHSCGECVVGVHAAVATGSAAPQQHRTRLQRDGAQNWIDVNFEAGDCSCHVPQRRQLPDELRPGR